MDTSRFHTTLAALALLLTACAPTPFKLTADATQRLRSAQVQVVHFDASDFTIVTPQQAMLGVL